MLEHDFQFRKIAAQRDQLRINEDRLAVKQVNLGRGHFTMQQQQQARALHGLQRLVGLTQVGHAGVAVGGGARRVELDGDHASISRTFDLIGGQVVGEVERHQRLKLQAGRHRCLDPLLVGERRRCRCDGRAQVGHDDGAAKLGGSVRHHRAQGVAITHVQMPVVGSGQGDGESLGLCHGRYCPKSANRINLLRHNIGRILSALRQQIVPQGLRRTLGDVLN